MIKVIYWWKLASDESYLVMKVIIVKEVKRSDGLWRFACGDDFIQFKYLPMYVWIIGPIINLSFSFSKFEKGDILPDSVFFG